MKGEDRIEHGRARARRVAWRAALALALSACASGGGEAADGRAERTIPQPFALYLCEGGRRVQAQFEPGFVRVRLPDGRSWKLPEAVSASGAKYSDGRVTFWTKGNTAFLEEDAVVTLPDCVQLSR